MSRINLKDAPELCLGYSILDELPDGVTVVATLCNRSLRDDESFLWYYDNINQNLFGKGRIDQTKIKCLTNEAGSNTLQMKPCVSGQVNQKWLLDNAHIVSSISKQCIGGQNIKGNNEAALVALEECKKINHPGADNLSWVSDLFKVSIDSTASAEEINQLNQSNPLNPPSASNTIIAIIIAIICFILCIILIVASVLSQVNEI